jgi:hypothetical protein
MPAIELCLDADQAGLGCEQGLPFPLHGLHFATSRAANVELRQ